MHCFEPDDPNWRTRIEAAAEKFATEVRSIAHAKT
jgi:hypothetical protein